MQRTLSLILSGTFIYNLRLAGSISVSQGKGPVMMDQVACEGHEKSLGNCRSVVPNQDASQRCSHPAVAVCREKLPFPGEIRVPGLIQRLIMMILF